MHEKAETSARSSLIGNSFGEYGCRVNEQSIDDMFTKYQEAGARKPLWCEQSAFRVTTAKIAATSKSIKASSACSTEPAWAEMAGLTWAFAPRPYMDAPSMPSVSLRFGPQE